MPVASKGKFKGNDTPSPWTLVFDTETTIDAAQQLRVGFYQVRKDEGLDREGVFYDPNSGRTLCGANANKIHLQINILAPTSL